MALWIYAINLQDTTLARNSPANRSKAGSQALQADRGWRE